MLRLEREDRGGDSGDERPVLIDELDGKLDVLVWIVFRRIVAGRGRLALFGLALFALVTMRGDEIGTIERAIDGDFAFASAADGADFLALGGAIALRRALAADGQLMRARAAFP